MAISRRWGETSFCNVRRLVEHYAKKDPDGVAYSDGGSPADLNESMKMLRAANHTHYRLLRTEPDYFEDLAILIDHEAITFPIVNECFGYAIPYRWSLWEPTIQELRRRAHEPLIYIEFEKLAYKLARINPNSVQKDGAGRIMWQGFID